MKAYKIDTQLRQVTEIEINEGNSLKEMQEVVGGLITVAAELENTDTMFVNDEGLFMFNEFFYFDGCYQPFAGNGVIVGTDEEGASVGAKSTLEEIKSRVKFLNRQQALRLAQELEG